MAAGEGLAEGPAGGGNIVGDYSTTITRCDLKREALPVEIVVALPVLSPVSGHWLPTTPGTLDGHRMYIAGSADVGDED